MGRDLNLLIWPPLVKKRQRFKNLFATILWSVVLEKFVHFCKKGKMEKFDNWCYIALITKSRWTGCYLYLCDQLRHPAVLVQCVICHVKEGRCILFRNQSCVQSIFCDNCRKKPHYIQVLGLMPQARSSKETGETYLTMPTLSESLQWKCIHISVYWSEQWHSNPDLYESMVQACSLVCVVREFASVSFID